MVLVNTGLRRAIGAGINKGLSFFAPLKTQITLARGIDSPTYTRATTAYVTDFEGLQKQVPSGCARFTGARMVKNECGYGSELGYGATVGSASGTTPPTVSSASFEGKTVLSMEFPTGGSGYAFSRRTGGDTNNVGCTIDTSLSPDKDFNASMKVAFSRPLVGSETIICYITGVAGSVEVITFSSSFCPTTLTRTAWAFTTATGTGKDGFYFYIGSPLSTPITVYATEFQIQDVTGQSNQNPSEYVSVGALSDPYHGAGVDGVKYFDTENGNTVTSNVVIEATGAAIADATLDGYLAEGQRQNRCLYSQDFTNAAWVSGGGGIAVTPNTAVAPDGTTTADTLTASGANGTLIQDLGVVASAAKAGGLYLKRKTGTGNIDLTLDGGATWTTVAVTSSWLPLEKTQTLADEDFGIRIVTSGDAVYAWQGQVETADFISSPIPTTTAAVTRNDDDLRYARAGNMDLSVGTLYAEFTTAPLIGSNHFLLGIDGANQIIATGPTHNRTSSYDNVTSFNSNIGGYFDAGVVKKAAITWQSSGRTMSYDGTAVTSGAFKGAWLDDSIKIGRNPNSSGDIRYAFGNIRNVKIWQTAKTDAQLQALTT